MLGASKFMVYFWGMHFNKKKALYINFKKRASIFCKAMLRTINCGGHSRCYVLPTIVSATTNNYLAMEYIYILLICKQSLANILNVSQRFIKLLHQTTNHTDLLVSLLTYIKETKKHIIILMMFVSIKRGYWWTYCNKTCQIDQWHYNMRWRWQKGVPPTSHLKAPVLCTLVLWAWIHCHKKYLDMTSYTTSAEYEPRSFDSAWTEG